MTGVQTCALPILLKPENVDELTGKCTHTAEKWGEVADHLWYSRPENQNIEIQHQEKTNHPEKALTL